MLITPAYAQAAGGDGGGGLVTLLPIVLIFVVFYFLLIRPQQKKMKQHKAMVEALRRGDKVVTGGGLIGTVAKVIDANELSVDLAEGVRVRVLRHTIQEVMSKPEPARAKKATGEAANDDAAGEGDAAGGAPPKPLSPLAGLGALFGLGGKK